MFSISLLESLHDMRGVVGGSVVHYQQFVIAEWKRLLGRCTQTTRQKIGPIVGAND
jgi:hypothetical protein